MARIALCPYCGGEHYATDCYHIPRSNQKFRPTVYSNQRPILTPEDLGNHPHASEYIEYLKHAKYATDFNTWLKREEIKERDLAVGDKQYVAACAADPYCRLPSKIRRHDPPSRGSNLWRRDR